MRATSLKGSKGLTLVELLIVLTFLAFLGTVLFGVFSSGAEIWARLENSKYDDDARLFFEKLADDLDRSVNFSMAKFSGRPDCIEFPIIAEDTYNAKWLKNNYDNVRQIKWVCYAFDYPKNAVVRTERDYSSYAAKLPAQPKILLRNVEKFDASYFCVLASDGELNKYESVKDGVFPKFIKLDLKYDLGKGRPESVTEYFTAPQTIRPKSGSKI